MLTDKNQLRLAELSKLGVPYNTIHLSQKILQNLEGENWAIFAKLKENPIEVQLYDQENEITIDISIIEKFKKK